MAISRYPRYGHRIAPSTLCELLTVEIPAKFSSDRSSPVAGLCDLDETSWNYFSPKACRELAETVVQQVGRSIHSIPQSVRGRLLPVPLEGVSLADLELQVRTYNCLSKKGFLDNPQRLKNQTVGDLLQIPGFGAKCLVDLLTSLESACPSNKLGERINVQGLQELIQEAKKLLRLRYAKIVYRDDPRLGQLIRTVDIRAASAWDMANRIVTGIHAPPPAVATQKIRILRRHILGFSHVKLEQELSQLVAAVESGRNRQLVMRFLGWDGCGGATLQVVGHEFGVTRERVRQISSRFIKAVSQKKPFAPILDKTLALLATLSPAPTEDMESQLMRKGLTKSALRLEGLLKTVEYLGRDVRWLVQKADKSRLMGTREHCRMADAIRTTARKSLGSQGVGTIADIAAQVEEKTKKPITHEAAVMALSSQNGFHWLDKQNGWFWLSSIPQKRNRLLNEIRKMLSVAGSIEISELRDGVRRQYRMKGFAPPRHVLLELCCQTPGLRTEGNTVIADPPIDPVKVLGKAERIMLRVMRDNGMVMQRVEFERSCLNLGVKRATFYVRLGYSPIFLRYAQGIYGLRGVEIPIGRIESFPHQKKARKVLEDYGWTIDRKIWIRYKLSRAMIASGVFYVPTAMKRFLEGQFYLKTADGARLGTLIVNVEKSCWGLGPFFSRRGGEPNDSLWILFDLETRESTVSISDQTLLEDIQDTVKTAESQL